MTLDATQTEPTTAKDERLSAPRAPDAVAQRARRRIQTGSVSELRLLLPSDERWMVGAYGE